MIRPLNFILGLVLSICWITLTMIFTVSIIGLVFMFMMEKFWFRKIPYACEDLMQIKGLWKKEE